MFEETVVILHIFIRSDHYEERNTKLTYYQGGKHGISEKLSVLSVKALRRTTIAGKSVKIN
jgi:hypothetical protein